MIAAVRSRAGLVCLLVSLVPAACGSSSTPSSAVLPDAAAAPSDGGTGAAGEDGGTGCSGAGTLCWGFEEGMTCPPGWKVGRTDYGAVVLRAAMGGCSSNSGATATGPALVVDETRPHWGRYSLHARGFVGGSPKVQGGPKATIGYTLPADFGSVLWGRAFVYLEPSAPASHAGIFNARYPPRGSTATAETTLDWYEVASYTQHYMTIWHTPEPPGYPEDVQVSGTPVVLDRFACLEWLFDGSPSDGGQASRPRLWVDGTELSWPDSYTYPDGSAPPPREPVDSFLMLETGVYLYQGLTASTDWWLDDLAVAPQRIGCGT